MANKTWLALALLGLLVCSSLVDASKDKHYDDDKHDDKYDDHHDHDGGRGRGHDYEYKKVQVKGDDHHDHDHHHHKKVKVVNLVPVHKKKVVKVPVYHPIKVVKVKHPKYVATVADWHKCKEYIPKVHYDKCDKEYDWKKKVEILTRIFVVEKCDKNAYAPVCSHDGYEYKNACYAKCFGVKYTVGACRKVVQIVHKPVVKKYVVKKYKIENRPMYHHEDKYHHDDDYHKKNDDHHKGREHGHKKHD